ncbi:hypothetical protein D3C71_1024670 [compost metagenome]
MQRHLAFAGELERVAEQVVEHLLQLGTVGDQRFRHRRIHLDGELQPAVHRHVAEVTRDLAGERVHAHFLSVHIHLAGFDLGQIEDVVDQSQQVGAGIMDDRGRFHFLRIQMAALVLGQLLGQDQQAVERRAQLMRHVGQEVGLVLAGTRQFLRLEFGFALQHLQHILLLVEHLGLLPQLLVGGLQFLGLHAQFFFRCRQALCVFFQLHGLALQLFIGRAQLFFLRLQGNLRLLQFFGLGAGVVEQQLGFVGAADVVQAQRDGRQHAVNERLLRGAEMMERAELEHAQQPVLEQQRHRHQMTRLRFAQRRMDAEEVVRHLLHADAFAFQRGLADQAIAQPVTQAQMLAPLEAVAALQLQFLLRFIPGEENTNGRIDARRDQRHQRLRVVLRRLCGLQLRAHLAHAELDPVGIARHQRVAAEHLHRAGDLADFIGTIQPIHFHVEIVIGQARHFFRQAVDRIHHRPRNHPQRADDDQEADHQQDQRNLVRARDPLAHLRPFAQQHLHFGFVDGIQRFGQGIALPVVDRMQAHRWRHCSSVNRHRAQDVGHFRIPDRRLRGRTSQSLALQGIADLDRFAQRGITAFALAAQHVQLLVALTQQVVADRDLLQTNRLDGVLDMPDHFDLHTFLAAGIVVLPGGAVADHAGGQETQKHQAECGQHLAQQ